jgi:hypothetical protein
MPEITVIEMLTACRTRRSKARGSLKNQHLMQRSRKSFFAFALNIGFFLCYFRRRVEFAGNKRPLSQT